MAQDAKPAGEGNENGNLTKEEIEAALEGPAVFANRVFATATPMGMRLTFVETQPERKLPVYRSAVFLQLNDALAFRDLLDRILAGARIETVSASAPEKSDG